MCIRIKRMDRVDDILMIKIEGIIFSVRIMEDKSLFDVKNPSSRHRGDDRERR